MGVNISEKSNMKLGQRVKWGVQGFANRIELAVHCTADEHLHLLRESG